MKSDLQMQIQPAREAGFSLVEMIIVVAVLAIISAIAIPWYQGYTVEARYGTAGKDIAQMQLILDDLAGDSDLGAIEPAGYANTVIGVYQVTGSGAMVLDNIGTTPPGAQPWLDPWGRIYRYQRPNAASQVYDLFSQGVNAADATDDIHKS